MTNEPPKGLRANMLRTFAGLDDRVLNDCAKPEVFRQLLFGFAFFHAIIQDRRKFGPIGWNIPYGFTNEDLMTCRRQLKHFLDNMDDIPYKVLNYLGSAINYGGRVTDDKDKRLINTILRTYICPDLVALGSDYKFSESGTYYCPKAETQESFLEYLKALPLSPAPEAFGMHENCSITCAQKESAELLDGVLSTMSGSTGGS